MINKRKQSFVSKIVGFLILLTALIMVLPTSVAEPASTSTQLPTPVTTVTARSAPTITLTVQPTSTPLVLASSTMEYQELKDKFNTALTNFRDAEDKLKVAEAKFEPLVEQYKAEKEAFDSISQTLTKEDKQVKKAELKIKGDELKLLGGEHQIVIKEFLNRRIDLLIAEIELFKYDAEFTWNVESMTFDSSATLDKQIEVLKQIRTRVQQASNKLEIKDINRDLKDIKEKFILERRYYKGIWINNKMGIFIARTEDASVRMDAMIKILNENGKDTSKLTRIASDFNTLITQAKVIHNKNLGIFSEHPGFDSSGMVTDVRNAQDFILQIREQQKDTQVLRTAIAELREFFGETKRLIKDTKESATPGTGGVNT